jgi:hypothetical protein
VVVHVVGRETMIVPDSAAYMDGRWVATVMDTVPVWRVEQRFGGVEHLELGGRGRPDRARRESAGLHHRADHYELARRMARSRRRAGAGGRVRRAHRGHGHIQQRDLSDVTRVRNWPCGWRRRAGRLRPGRRPAASARRHAAVTRERAGRGHVRAAVWRRGRAGDGTGVHAADPGRGPAHHRGARASAAGSRRTRPKCPSAERLGVPHAAQGDHAQRAQRAAGAGRAAGRLQRAHGAVRGAGARDRACRRARPWAWSHQRQLLLPRVARGLAGRRWVAVDPTLGQYPADASHLRFLVGGLARQVELIRLIGRLQLEVL